jgi:hypothetical protein
MHQEGTRQGRLAQEELPQADKAKEDMCPADRDRKQDRLATGHQMGADKDLRNNLEEALPSGSSSVGQEGIQVGWRQLAGMTQPEELQSHWSAT